MGDEADRVVPTTCDETLWYFAYGSNLHDAIFRERRAMTVQAVHPARLDGFQLRFDLPIGPGERGVANLAPIAGAHVWGAIYLVTVTDCARLDRTEGVHFGAYVRLLVDVERDDGTRAAAFTYCSARSVPGRKPSARYLGLILEGARQRGLPENYVRWLESFELAHDERETAIV